MKSKAQISEMKYNRISQHPAAEIAIAHYRDNKDFFKIHEAIQAVKVGDFLYACVRTKSGGKTHVKWNVSEGVARKDSMTYNTLGKLNIW